MENTATTTQTQRFNIGDKVTDRDGYSGTITGVTKDKGGLWYDVRFARGCAVRFDSDFGTRAAYEGCTQDCWDDKHATNCRFAPLPTGATVTDYSLKAFNGKHIRYATRVTFPNGRQVSFMDRMPKGEAIAQAEQSLYRGYVGHFQKACPDQEPMSFEYWKLTLGRQ